jgi:hypothetical protein
MHQGIILYRGPSNIDGGPIVAIATGLVSPARNTKTGPMVQIYILRADRHPLSAVHSGEAASVCGTCAHAGRVEVGDDGKKRNVGRSCYVTLIHGPSIVWKHFSEGKYAEVTRDEARRLLAGRIVRVGAYGDPSAVPMDVWTTALDRVADLTGYTHFWRDHPQLKAFCMASVETAAERREAKILGFRTYRARKPDDPLLEGEGHCPNDKDKSVICMSCMLCGGERSKAKADITTVIHGTGKVHFLKEFA